jgi:hypothetical protein
VVPGSLHGGGLCNDVDRPSCMLQCAAWSLQLHQHWR